LVQGLLALDSLAQGARAGNSALSDRRRPRSPHGAGYPESLHALDWLNFYLAALLAGVGPFISVYLTDRGWVAESIGLVLTASGIAGLLTQVPAGELIDRVKSKRAVVGAATAAFISVVLVYCLRPDLPSVFPLLLSRVWPEA
jgi:MFS family permease